MTGVVLDTNILVSGNIKYEGLEAFVLSLALNQQVVLYVSEPILDEYERVLRYSRLKFLSADIERFLARVRRVASLVSPAHTLTRTQHESDNRFLECAEESKAEFLVTGNKRHFPARWKTPRIVNAREFFEMWSKRTGR